MKFSTKITLFFSSIIFIAGLLVTWFIYISNVRMIEKRISENLEDAAYHTMDKIDRVIYERYMDIKIIASDPVIRSSHSTPGQITERLIEYRNNLKHYVSLTYFDLNRVVVADSSGMYIGRQHSFNEYWPGIAEGRDFVLVLADSEMVRQKVICFASKVKDSSGKTVGVIVTRMPVVKIYELIGRITTFKELQENMTIDLVDANGLLLYSSYNKEGILKDVSPDFVSIKKYLQKGEKRHSFRQLNTAEKEEEILAFTIEEGYLDFKGNGWILIADIPTNIAFAPAVELRNRMIMIFLAAAGLSMLLIYLTAKSVSRPIVQLMNASVEAGRGNFETRVDIPHRDEIGQLGEAFNKMIIDLKDSQEKLLSYSRDLELKVKERTEKLSDANMKLEIELKTRLLAEETLCELSEYNRKILESLNAGIWIINLLPLTAESAGRDPEYFWHSQVGVEIVTVDVNNKMCEMLGLTKEDMTGKSIFDPVFVDEENAKIYVNEISARREGKRSSYELIIKHKDGHPVPVLVSAVPLVTDTDTGKTIQSVGVFTDLSKLKQIEEELLKAQKLESVGILAGGIAHDFNNLLAVILGNVGFAKMLTPQDNRTYDKLAAAELACMRATELTNRFLTLSAAGEPFRKKTSIAEIIRDAAANSVEGDKVKIQLDLQDDVCSVEADERQMKQVFMNIITNAVESMTAGGVVRIRGENIEITDEDQITLKSGKYARISVTDSGVGIPEENLSKIFDPYFSTKPMGSRKGQGLGLTVSYSIVKKHKGLITVESKPGKGSTFNIYLPAAA